MSTTPPTAAEIVADLDAEHQSLDSVLAGLSPDDWARPTPSPGWTVADQIGHLGYFDRTATLAIMDPDGFQAHLAEVFPRVEAGEDLTTLTLSEPRSMGPDALLEWWRDGRRALISAAGGLDDDTRLAWYGPPMSARSFLTARLMETWAHGQDVRDALGVEATVTGRLRHVAQLGVITRSWSYINRGKEPPDAPVRVELQGPSGEVWTWGDDSAGHLVAGPVLDFCLVVTQRRHVDDTDLVATDGPARDWMLHAQAFAGGPTDGPPPR